jgi:hypothetical protein
MTCQPENKENFGENESTHFSQGSPLHHLHIDSFMDLEYSEVRPTRKLTLLPKRNSLFPIEHFSSPFTERSNRNVLPQDTSNVGVHFSPSSSNLWLLNKDEAEEGNSFSPNAVQYPLEMRKAHNCALQLTPIALSPDDTFYNSKVSYIDLKLKPSRIEAMGYFEQLPISPRYDEIEYLDFISPISESFECRNVKSIYLPSLES